MKATENIEVKAEEVVSTSKRKISVQQLLVSMAGNIKKVEEGKLLNAEEVKIFKNLYKKVRESWVSQGITFEE